MGKHSGLLDGTIYTIQNIRCASTTQQALVQLVPESSKAQKKPSLLPIQTPGQKPPLSAAYRKVRNHYVAELRSAERQYYTKQVSALQSARLVNDPHRWWKTAKAACGLNSVDSIPPLLHNDCMKVTAEEKAACLNSVFAKQCNAQSPTSRSCSLSTNTTAGNFSFSRIEYPSVTKKIINTQRLEGLWQQWDS